MMKEKAITRAPRRLLPTPSGNSSISFPNINSTPAVNRIILEGTTTSFKPEYRKEAQQGLIELLETVLVREEVKQCSLDELSYMEFISSINKEEPRKKTRAPRPRKGPGRLI